MLKRMCVKVNLRLFALILLETSALYKLFTYLLTYLREKPVNRGFSSDVARKGHGGQLPQNCRIPPKQINLKIFLTSFATNVPQNVTVGGTFRSQHCFVPPFS